MIEESIVENVEAEKFKISIKDDYLILVIREHTAITVELLKEILRVMSNYNKQTIIKLEPYIEVEKESREYFDKTKKYWSLSNTAVIAATLNEQLHVNFYNKFYKPKAPIKIVKSESEAITWLKLKELENKIQ